MCNNLVELDSQESRIQLPIRRNPFFCITCHCIDFELFEMTDFLQSFKYGPFPVIQCITEIL
jgi:hypothetical protein